MGGAGGHARGDRRLNIRKATAADLHYLPKIEAAAATLFAREGYDATGLDQVTPAEVWSDYLDTIWVAEEAGALAGFLGATPESDGLHIAELDVHPDFQRRGIGRALLRAAAEYARAEGYPRLILTTFADVPWNAPFYAAQGFAPFEGEPAPWLVEAYQNQTRQGLDMARRCTMVLGFDQRGDTALIHSRAVEDAAARTVGPPIQRGSTVLIDRAADLYDADLVTYGRAGLATQEALIAALAELERAQTVRLFPSGLAAVTGALLAVLKAGDEVLASDCVYRPTRRFIDNVLKRFGVSARWYPGDASAGAVMAMAGPATRLILMESPGSLTFEMQDVAAVAAAARARGVLTMMDNTWGAGLIYKPLDHGVDLSVQALTKYVGGHSDVFMGSVATREAKLGKQLDDSIWDFGWAVSPDDAYQMLRGLRTLGTRMARHGENGLAVAAWLQRQPQVLEVLHPALPGCRHHDLWSRDYAGACGLFSVVLKPGPRAAMLALLDSLKLFGLGFSWGGFESLAVDADRQLTVRRFKGDFAGPILRLHVGLEDPADLITDLRRGLAAYDAA